MLVNCCSGSKEPSRNASRSISRYIPVRHANGYLGVDPPEEQTKGSDANWSPIASDSCTAVGGGQYKCPRVGNSFNMLVSNGINLAQLPAGKIIFKNLLLNPTASTPRPPPSGTEPALPPSSLYCLSYDISSDMHRSNTSSDTVSELTKNTAGAFGLSASAPLQAAMLKGTITANAGHGVFTKGSIQTAQLIIEDRNGSISLNENFQCINESNLDDGLILQFKYLPRIHL